MIKSFVLLASLAAPLAGPLAAPLAAPAPQCEAHFFPTDEVVMATTLGEYGLLSDLLAGSAPPEGAIISQITSARQIDLMQRAIRARGHLEGFRFVAHDRVIMGKRSYKDKARFTASQTACYVEVVIGNVTFSDTALSKKKLGVFFVTRDFRARPEKAKVHRLGGAAPIAPHIETDPTTKAPISIDYAAAFEEALDAAIERFWKL